MFHPGHAALAITRLAFSGREVGNGATCPPRVSYLSRIASHTDCEHWAAKMLTEAATLAHFLSRMRHHCVN
jgi:hypothetical protein